MRKSNDEIYQLAKDQALVKKLKKNKRFRRQSDLRHWLNLLVKRNIHQFDYNYSLFVDL
jgi:hypothetical protein